jgi:probable F420-dependent oxidoreductase
MRRVGIILDAENISDIVDLSHNAEAAGFDSVWATELYRTSFQQLSVAALSTKNIRLGTAVSLAFARSPLITSLSALDLDELSKGRLILGLGSGAKRTNENFHGLAYGKPVARIKECIELIRLITGDTKRHDPIKFEGEYYKVNLSGYHRPFKSYRESIPIFLGGVGGNMIRAAAEVADGYLGHVVCSLRYIKEVVNKSLKEGFERTGREGRRFQKASIITCVISKKKSDAKEAAKRTIAFYATVRTYRPPFLLHGFERETQKIRDAYFSGDMDSMFRSVTDEMVNTFAVVGNTDEVLKKIDAYKQYIDLPILSAPHYFLDFEEVREYQNKIFDSFGV